MGHRLPKVLVGDLLRVEIASVDVKSHGIDVDGKDALGVKSTSSSRLMDTVR